MDKRERVLSMGYLVKSPTKNMDKANFSRFWKLRWCVFAEIVYLNPNQSESTEDKRLVLYYYKDKESQLKDANAKGQLSISESKSIKSCYQSQAGFDHIFKIECADGKIVKFSAPSCQTKFRWITILYNHKFNANIKQGMFSSSGNFRNRREKRMSLQFERDYQMPREKFSPVTRTASFSHQSGYSPIGFMQKEPSRDSGFSADSFTLSESGPPLPPRCDTHCKDSQSSLLEDQISICSMLSDGRDSQYDPAEESPPRKSSFNEERDLAMLQIFNDLFKLCEVCQKENGGGKKISKRRKSQIMKDKMNKCAELTEVEYDRSPVSPTGSQDFMQDFDRISRETVSSEESFPGESEVQVRDVNVKYTEINEEWLMKVREKTEQLAKADSVEEEQNVNQEEEDEDAYVYEDMSACARKMDLINLQCDDGDDGKSDASLPNLEDNKFGNLELESKYEDMALYVRKRGPESKTPVSAGIHDQIEAEIQQKEVAEIEQSSGSTDDDNNHNEIEAVVQQKETAQIEQALGSEKWNSKIVFQMTM